VKAKTMPRIGQPEGPGMVVLVLDKSQARPPGANQNENMKTKRTMPRMSSKPGPVEGPSFERK